MVHTIKSKVKKVAWKKQGKKHLQIEDPQLFGIGDQIRFQGQSATVMDIQEDILTVDTVLHLRSSDHTVSVKKFIYEPNEANIKVADAWNAFFQKDKHTPLDSWGEVEDILPQLPPEHNL